MSKAKVGEREKREQLVEAMLDEMAEGKSLDQAIKAMGRPCTAGTMRKWIAEDETWTKRYSRAKKLLAQAWAEEAIQIARESTSYTTATDRVLIETLKWAAAKANPAEFGEKQTVEHQGQQTLQVRVVEENVPERVSRTQIADAVGAAMLMPAVFAVPEVTS